MSRSVEESDIQTEIQRLKNLITFKNKSEDYIRAKAIEIARKKKVDIEVDDLFTNTIEKNRAKDLLYKYLEDFSIENISDKNTLRQLIYLEIIQKRIHEKLNEHYNEDKKAVPMQLVDVIHKNSDAILKLKDTLGLGKGKGQTGYDAVKHLMSRYKKWRGENQASRTLICPHCGKMVLLKMRMEFWKSQKHPFFKDKTLYNTHLFKMFKEGLITREDISKVLECSPNYIDWVMDKIEKPKELIEKQEKSLADQLQKCPECKSGFLSNRWSKAESKWEEHCTECEYKKLYECRRKIQTDIIFKDRRIEEQN